MEPSHMKWLKYIQIKRIPGYHRIKLSKQSVDRVSGGSHHYLHEEVDKQYTELTTDISYSCISSGLSWGLMIPGTSSCCFRLFSAASRNWASLSSKNSPTVYYKHLFTIHPESISHSLWNTLTCSPTSHSWKKNTFVIHVKLSSTAHLQKKITQKLNCELNNKGALSVALM